MQPNSRAEIFEAISSFIRKEPYYGGLWRGLHIILMDYLANNADAGLHNEVGSIFFDDLGALLELLWDVRNIVEKERG